MITWLNSMQSPMSSYKLLRYKDNIHEKSSNVLFHLKQTIEPALQLKLQVCLFS